MGKEEDDRVLMESNRKFSQLEDVAEKILIQLD